MTAGGMLWINGVCADRKRSRVTVKVVTLQDVR